MITILIIISLIISLGIILYLTYKIFFNKENKSNNKKVNKQEKLLLLEHKVSNNQDFYFKDPVIIIKSKFDNNKIEFTSPQSENIGHTLIVGSSGSGKSERFYKPNILLNAKVLDEKLKPSMIISDTKPNGSKNDSLYESTKDYLLQYGYKIIRINLNPQSYKNNFDFNKKQSVPTDFFNPLLLIWKNRNNTLKINDYINQFASLITTNREAIKKDPHWENASKAIIMGWIWWMIENDFEKEYFNIANLKDLLSIHFEQVGKDILKKGKGKSFEYTFSLIKSLEEKSITKELHSILTTLNLTIDFFKDEVINLISSTNSFELSDIKNNPTALFIQSEFINESYNKFSSILITQLIEELKLVNNNRSIFMMLDEFNNLAKINNFSTYLDKTRSNKIWWMIGIQSLAKTEMIYGNIEQIIPNFYIKLIFNTDSNKDIESLIGHYEKYKHIYSYSGSDKGFSYSTSERKDEVVLFKDIKTLKNGEAYYILRGQEPKKTQLDGAWNLSSLISTQNNSYNLTNLYNPIVKKQMFQEEEQNINNELLNKIQDLNIQLKKLNINYQVKTNINQKQFELEIENIINIIKTKDQLIAFNDYLKKINNANLSEREKSQNYDKLKSKIANIFKTNWIGKEANKKYKEIKEQLDKMNYKEFEKNEANFILLISQIFNETEFVSEEIKINIIQELSKQNIHLN